MTNTQIIKKYLLPLLVPKEDNPYKSLFVNGFKTDFIKSIIKLDNATKIDRDSLRNKDFNQALNKYAKIINAWHPEKTLEVFWITGIKIYTIDQYAVLKAFFKQYNIDLYNELMNLNVSIEKKELHKEILLKLAINGDLTQNQYTKFEEQHIDFIKDEKPNINDFKVLYQIGNIYNSDLIWENYLKYYKSNQILINNVKNFFEEEKIEYFFKEEPIDIYVKKYFTRTLYLNPEYICKYNAHITTDNVDNVVKGFIEYYLKLAQDIQKDITIDTNYYKSAHMMVMVHFNKYSSLEKYEEKLEDFNKYLKYVAEKITIDKNKDEDKYFEEIDKIYLYCKIQDKYDNKQIEKKSKI